jgi:WD40 repeat protein
MANRQYGKALRIYKAVLRTAGPGLRARLAGTIRKLETAVAGLKRKPDPRRAAALGRLWPRALLAESMGRYAEARKLFEQMAQNTTDPGLWAWVGRMRVKTKDLTGARMAFARALAMAELKASKSARLTPQLKHFEDLFSVIFAPDGKLYAFGYDETRSWALQMWDVRDRTLVRTFKGRLSWTKAVALHPDGRLLVTAESMGALLFWGLRWGTLFHVLTPLSSTSLLSLAFGDSGRLLAGVGESFHLWIWDVKARKLLRRFKHGQEFAYSVAFDPRARRVYEGTGKNRILVWNVKTGKRIRELRGHSDRVYAVAVGRRGKLLASGGKDRTVRLWKARTGKLLRTFHGHTARVNRVAFDPAGKLIASASNDKTVRLWRASGPAQDLTLRGHKRRVLSAIFGRKGRLLASAGKDNTVKLWDPRTGKMLRSYHLYAGELNGMALGPKGRFMATADKNRMAQLWDLSACRLVRVLRGHKQEVAAVAFGPRGKLLASGDKKGTVKIWDTRTHRLVRRLTPPVDSLGSVAFGPDGRRVAASGDRKILVWNVATGRLLKVLKARNGYVRQVTFLPDGRHLIASCPNTCGFKLWDISTGQYRPMGRPGVISLALQPGGQLLAIGNSSKTIELWNLLDLKKPPTILRGHTGGVGAVAFGPRKQLLVSGSADRTVRLWDVSTGRLLATMRGHRCNASGMAVGPKGRFAFASCSDRTVKVWDLRKRRLVATLVGTDRGEWLVYTPDGYVDASGPARALIHWRVGHRVYPHHLAWQRHHVRGLLCRVLKNDTAFRLKALRSLINLPKAIPPAKKQKRQRHR